MRVGDTSSGAPYALFYMTKEIKIETINPLIL
jgi:hypothetical protein